MLSEKEKKARAAVLLKGLTERYPSAECALKYGGDPWRLLVMGRLSAQCTDARVNTVCVTLFEKYPTCRDMALADINDVEKLVFSCGVYRVKARNIIDFSRMICEKYNGKVPDNMEALLTLPGVGRKIANLILGDIYGKPAVVCDTHCIRIANRVGLSDSRDPYKTELSLSALIPGDGQSDFCHRLVLFGREICKSQNPDCAGCPFAGFGCKK